MHIYEDLGEYYFRGQIEKLWTEIYIKEKNHKNIYISISINKNNI